jgi:hypothetical protein
MASSHPQQLSGPIAVSFSIGGMQQLAHSAAAEPATTARRMSVAVKIRVMVFDAAKGAPRSPYSLVSLRYDARCRSASVGRPSFSASVAALK